jgi:hypothetical protein
MLLVCCPEQPHLTAGANFDLRALLQVARSLHALTSVFAFSS